MEGPLMLTVNKKLLLYLFIGLVVFSGGLFLVNYIQADRAIDALRWQSEHAAEQGKLDKAILYMRQYLDLRGDDHDAAVKLAEMILQKGNSQRQLTSALFLYERVLREAPQREDVRQKLADLALRLNRFGDAQIHIRAMLDKSPNDSGLWERLGRCQVALNKLDDARTSFEKAIAADAQNIRACELLVDLLVNQLNLPDEGREWLDKLVRANPRKPEAYLARARYWKSIDKETDCQRDLERALEIEPENADGLLMLAELMHNKGDAPQARTLLAKGLARHPKDVRYYRLLSWIELMQSNLAAGIDCLEKGVRELPNSFELLMPLGDLLVQHGEPQKAREILRKLDNQRGFVHQARYLRSRLLMAEGKWKDATDILEPLRTQAVAMPGLSAQVNWLLAVSHERLGNNEAQMEALKRVLAIEPGHLNARLKFGTMHISAGRFDEAVKEYIVAARSPYAPLGSRITLGRLFVARAKTTGANEDWKAASDFVDALRKKYPNTVDPVLLAAEMNLARGKHDVARKLLREEAGRKVNDQRIWSALAAVELDGAGLYAAIEVIDEAQAMLGDSVDLRLARARVWSNDWQPGRAERIRALSKVNSDLAEAEQLRLLAGLTDVCAAIRDYEGVKQLQQQLATRLPRELGVRKGLFASAARTGDAATLKVLQSEIGALQKTNEETLAVCEALAALPSFKSGDPRIEKAQDLARRLLATSPDRADVHFLAANLNEMTGETRAAMRHYELAVEFERNNLAYLEGQLAAQIRAGIDLKPRFEQLLGDPRLSWEGFRSLVEGALARVDAAQFDKCMTALNPLVRKSGTMLLWAASLEQARGNEDRAFALIDQACKLAPKMADAWIARLRLRPKEVDTVLPLAREAVEERVYFQICAECADAIRQIRADWDPPMSKPSLRRTWTRASMSRFVIRSQVPEATAILKKLANDPKASADDVAWAKRTSTLLEAAGGSPAERRQALTALRDWKPGADATLDELRTHVTSLAMAARHLYGSERKQVLQQAVNTLKQITTATGASARDWYHLSQFQAMVGDREAEKVALKTAMQKDENNLFYVVAYVEDLLTDGKQAEAEPLVGRLQAAVNDPRATATAAKYHCLAGAPEKVMEVIEKYERACDAGTPEGFARQRQAAELLDQSARLAASKGLPFTKKLITSALDKYRFVLKNFPESAGPMAALLAFDGNAQAAYDLLAQSKASLSLQALTSGAMGVVRVGNSTPKHFQIVHGWIDEALVQDPKNLTLRLSMAELLALKHEYAKAEPIYREALKTEPDNVIALNNLAWILAPRRDASEEAMKCVEHALEISGPTGELLDTRGRIQIARGNYDRAIEDLNQALQQGQTPLRWFHLSIAQFKQAKKDDSLKSFKEAKARGIDARIVHPDDVPMYKVMASQMVD